MCAYEVVPTARRMEQAESLKQEVLSLTSEALLKQNASFNCNGRVWAKKEEKKGEGEEEDDEEKAIDVL